MMVLFILMFLLQMQLPKKFVWNPTFYHADRQPFGCYVFDSIMRQSLPQGYQVTAKTFRQLDEENRNRKIAVVVLDNSLRLKKVDVGHLRKIAQRGGKVMVAYHWGGSDELDSSFHVDMSSGAFYLDNIMRRMASQQDVYDTLTWCGYPLAYPQREYRLIDQLISGSISLDSASKATVLAYSLQANRKFPSAVSLPCGKGEVIFVATPLLFTNMGVLDDVSSQYVFRIMSQMADLPVYRTEAYLESKVKLEAEQSPLRELLKRPPLRWAVYLMMLGVVLFMIFTARRHQRVIPIMEKPKNRSLEFIQLIGTLYYQRHDHADLVRKKFRFFAEEVRRNAGIDIGDVNQGDADCRALAEIRGMDVEKIKETIREIRLVIHSDLNIPARQMRKLIDEMNRILENIQ